MSNSAMQTGAILPLVALCLVALCGLAALAIDLGLIYLARQRAQNVVDAAALAGGQRLPDTGQASRAGSQVVAANNADGPRLTVTSIAFTTAAQPSLTRDDGTQVTVGAGNGITVEGYVNAPLAFAPIVGFTPASLDSHPDTLSVRATASVILQNACGLPPGVGVAPFGLIGDDPDSPDETVRYVATLLSTAPDAQTPLPATYQPVSSRLSKPFDLKINVWDQSGHLAIPGNADPLQMSGQGATYVDTIRHTTDQTLQVGQTLPTLSGNNVLLSRDGVNARLSPSNTAFTHDYALSPAYINWFFGDQSKPVDASLPPVTDPNTGTTYYYRLDPHRQEPTDAHIMEVPIVSQSIKNAPGTVTILAFAAFFIEQPYSRNAAGGLIAQGRFIGLTLPGGSGGECTGAGDKAPPRLVR